MGPTIKSLCIKLLFIVYLYKIFFFCFIIIKYFYIIYIYFNESILILKFLFLYKIKMINYIFTELLDYLNFQWIQEWFHQKY